MINKIYKTVKSVLFTDPKLLYKENRGIIDKPFHFQGTNGKAVLLIHGWTAVPYEVRRLGKYLNENGYTASGPMLRGHGTVPKDLEGIKWTDWLEDVRKNYEELKKSHEKVFVAGTSIGANLALLLAQEEKSICGLVLMATPYEIKLEKLTLFFAKILSLFKKYSRKFYPPTFGVSTTITRLISYQTYPISSALESFYLIKESRKNLLKITQPCFLIQSSSDHIINKKSMEEIYNRINSPIKAKRYVNRAYHTFISDIKNENVFQDILNFLSEN